MNQFETTQFVFQAAVGRSGSTILRHSIGLHPDIYYNGRENNLIQDVASVAHLNCTRASRVYAMKVDQSTYDEKFRNLICDLTWPDQVLATAKPVHFAAINPTAENLDYLCQVFPNMKVVCLVRNGLEVVCSREKYESFSGDEFEIQCRAWIRYEGMLDWGERNPSRFFLFRHEWTYDAVLIAQKLDEMFRWVGIAASEAVLANIRDVIEYMPTTKTPKAFSKMTSQEKCDYFRATANRFHGWDETQRKRFVEICGGLMQRLGYEIPDELLRKKGLFPE